MRVRPSDESATTPGGAPTAVDLSDLARRIAALHDEYAAAAPYPHIVLDDVLPADVFAAAARAFPSIDDPHWIGYLHVNETKYANPHPETWAPVLVDVARALTSERFVQCLGELTGLDGLRADWSMDGGGLHQTLRGGHLNVHTDFTTHHLHRNWRRRVNLLLYLNETWDPAWDGALQLWPTDMSACERAVAPVGNRILVFATDEHSLHGHPEPLNCPPDVARRSLALYYFTVEERPASRATHYRARPTDRGWKAALIWADRLILAGYDRVKRRFGLSDNAVERWLRRVDRHRAKR